MLTKKILLDMLKNMKDDTQIVFSSDNMTSDSIKGIAGFYNDPVIIINLHEKEK